MMFNKRFAQILGAGGKRLVHNGNVVESKITNLGLILPIPAHSKNFVQYIRIKNMVYLSGHLPMPGYPGGTLIVGKLGKDVSIEEGYAAARLVGLNLCATLKANIGDLDKVKRIVKLTGFVNCVDGFDSQPQVMNGCSELFYKIFGDEVGSHCRTSIGVNALPMGVPVEIDAIVEVDEDLASIPPTPSAAATTTTSSPAEAPQTAAPAAPAAAASASLYPLHAHGVFCYL